MVSASASAALDDAFARTGTIVARPLQKVQLRGVDVSGWLSARWEIKSYPETFTPISGWNLDAATGYYFSTDATPAPFLLPGNDFGKWEIDLTVNGSLYDDSLRIVVPSPAGLVDTALAESRNRSGFRGLARDVNRNWRAIDDNLRRIRTVGSASGDGGARSVPAVSTTPGWIVVGAFVPTENRSTTFRLIGCVSQVALTMHGRLFDVTAAAAVAATVTISATTPSVVDSSSVALLGGHLYQMQVEVVGGNTDTDFGAVLLMQPLG